MGAQSKSNDSQAVEQSLDALCQAAEASLEAGNLPDSFALFLRAMDAEPSSARAWGGIGVGCFRQGLSRAARIFFEMAVRLDPSDEDSILNWAESTGRELTDLDVRQFLTGAGVDAALVAKALEVRKG